MIDLLRAYKKADPAAKSYAEILLLYPGIKAIFLHRIAHKLYKARVPFLPRLISEISRLITLIEIHPGAKIGHRVVIDHGLGIIIGETAKIGDDCLIYNGVSFGGLDARGEDGCRHPQLGQHVLVGTGAKILGPVKIGDYAVIGANAVVTKDVPAHTTVVGIPARMIKRKNNVKKKLNKKK